MPVQQPVQFGRLTVKEKSIREASGDPHVGWYRKARNQYRNALDKLDEAGLDITVRGTVGKVNGEKASTIWSYVSNKNRDVLAMTAHRGDESPWQVLESAIAKGLQLITFDNPRVAVEPQPWPLVDMKNGKRYKSDQGVLHRLTSKGEPRHRLVDLKA